MVACMVVSLTHLGTRTDIMERVRPTMQERIDQLDSEYQDITARIQRLQRWVLRGSSCCGLLQWSLGE